MANFLVGRFQAESKGLPMPDGAAYELAIAKDDQSRDRPFRSWAEIGAAMRARGKSQTDGWARSDGNYVRLAHQTLAELVDLLDAPAARSTYAALLAAQAPAARPAEFAQQPSRNVVPRGMQRVPGNARACTASAGLRG
jgi:hypothetical protein